MRASFRARRPQLNLIAGYVADRIMLHYYSTVHSTYPHTHIK